MRTGYLLLSEEVQTHLAAQHLSALVSGPGVQTGISWAVLLLHVASAGVILFGGI